MARAGYSPGRRRGSPVTIQGAAHVGFAVDKLTCDRFLFSCFSLLLTLISPSYIHVLSNVTGVIISTLEIVIK